MKILMYVLSIIINFGFIALAFADDTDDKSKKTLNSIYRPYKYTQNSNINYDLYKYKERHDLLDYVNNPYINNLRKTINKENLYSYALSHHSNIIKYDVSASPIQKYSAGITNFSIKSMNIFAIDDYDTALSDSIYSMLISSILGFATKDFIGLNIWSGTDERGVSGFQATVKPFKNLYIAYSYLKDQHYNKSIIKFNFGYKKYSNLVFKTMNTFSNHHLNTTLGIEWQFYF